MNKELLKNICAVKGASGEEGAIAEFIINEIKGLVDDCTIDPLGNVIAHKKGTGKKMMLAGHMDQIGMMVTFIDKEGFLRFTNIGGLSPVVIHSTRVRFANGTIGVVGCERLDDPTKMNIGSLYIDIGAKNQEEAEKVVKIGDIAIYAEVPFVDEQKVVSPYLDDRLGCFIMIEALKKLKKCQYDLYLVFTVQEEVGLRGARTSAYTVDPDYGIAFDVTGSADTPKCKKLPMKMYGGAAIKIKDSSVICHPTIVKFMEKCAIDGKIRHQFEILEAGGTDSGAIHVSRGGVPSGVISIPTRYIHGMNEMASLDDIQDCIDLTVKCLETKIS